MAFYYALHHTVRAVVPDNDVVVDAWVAINFTFLIPGDVDATIVGDVGVSVVGGVGAQRGGERRLQEIDRIGTHVKGEQCGQNLVSAIGRRAGRAD